MAAKKATFSYYSIIADLIVANFQLFSVFNNF